MNNHTLTNATLDPLGFEEAFERIMRKWFKENPTRNRLDITIEEVEAALNPHGWTMGGADFRTLIKEDWKTPKL